MKITRLPKDTGPAGWNALLEPNKTVPSLEDDISADWLVIGAGFAGLAAARRLSQNNPGDSIVLLDAVGIGEGPVGRNSGFMIDLPHVLTSDNYRGEQNGSSAGSDNGGDTAANRAAIAFALNAAAEYALPDEAIRRVGKINGAATPKGDAHNRDYAKHLEAIGEPHRMIDATEMKAITGSDYYLGGLFTPGTAMLQPALFARGVASGLLSNRVRIFDHSPVRELKQTNGIWTARTPNGSVMAPKVILGVNGHVQHFGGFKNRLMHVMLYASMTRALTGAEVAALGGNETWGVTPSDPMGTTVRRIAGTGGHRIVVRNRCTYAPSLELKGDNIGRIAEDHDRSFANRFPSLAHVEMEYRWAGRLCLTRNDAPAFGEIDDGLYSACCQNGLGAAKGTFSGVAAADLASGRTTDFTQFMAAKPAPIRLLPAALMQIGAPATIRWREYAAGREI
ncbi:MAG: FAD-binding oxidoreductase [Pseudomonadota bacterium]